MSEKDFAIGTVAAPGPGSAISKKPCYLITLDSVQGKGKISRFIAVDNPSHTAPGCIQVKGIFSDEAEEDIVKGFADILMTTPKEQQLEMMFPWQRVMSIRSLVFNAVKPVMINK